MPRRHWSHADFVVVDQSIDGDYGVQFGYCRKCHADMQRFMDSAAGEQPRRWGPLTHYNSHGNYRRYGGR